MSKPKQQAQKIKLKFKQPQRKKQTTIILSSPSEKAKNILASVEQKLMNDLHHESITIPSKQKPYLQINKKEDSKKQQWIKLQKIIQEKQQMKKKLIQVEKSERILKSHLDISTIRQRSTYSVRPRSELSNQDIEKLKKLKKEQKQFQQELSAKTKAFQENQKKHIQQQQKLMQIRKKETNQKKKIEIEKRLKQLSQRQAQRKNKFEEEKKLIAKVKMQKRLHQELTQKFEKIQKQTQERKKIQYEQRKKEKSIDLSELKDHQRKYEQILRRNRDQLSRKRIQASRISNKLFKSKVHQSKFYTLIVQEQEKKKKQSNERKQIIIELVEKKKEFAEAVKRDFVPKSRVRSEDSEQQTNKKSKVQKIRLDPQQFRKKGLEYLQQSKKKAQKHKQKSVDLQKFSQVTTKQPKYKDYLTQSRRNRDHQTKPLKLERNFDLDVQEAKKIMKMTSFSDQQKIQRVKMLAQRMQFDPKTSKSSTLLKKIQAKIQILEALK